MLSSYIFMATGRLLTSDSVSDGSVSADVVSENAVSENIIESLGNIESAEDLQRELGVFQQMVRDWPEKLIKFAIKFGIALIIFFICSKLINLIRKLVKRGLAKAGAEAGVIQFLDSFVKVILYFLVFVGLCSFFGIQTTSLITLIGSAGVAFALALQGSLSNFIGGVLILLIKPFKVGDYIVVNGSEGTVTTIELFYTHLRTVDDRIVILPNGNLANSSLTNLNLSPHRRLCLKVGISYNSDIRKAKDIIRKCIESDERAIEGGIVDIYVDALDESQVTLGFRYYVENDDYFASKWYILEEIKYAFDENGIEIPFNQMDVNIKK